MQSERLGVIVFFGILVPGVYLGCILVLVMASGLEVLGLDGHDAVLAEQALRSVVIDRRMTQGTRGEVRRRWCERAWTARASCAQQGRSVFEFLHGALHAHFTAQPAPSLLPA
jgi:hypothetical protein